MKPGKTEDEKRGGAEIPAVPLSVEGFAVLHQMFRIARRDWRALDSTGQHRVVSEATGLLGEMARREDGESTIFSELGHKGDILIVHFRRTFD